MDQVIDFNDFPQECVDAEEQLNLLDKCGIHFTA